MGKASRDKGARGERQVVGMFIRGGIGARRTVGQSRDGSDAPDVDVLGIPHLWVEVKLGKKPNIRAALEQASFAKAKDQSAVAVTRDDGKGAIVSMGFDLFALLLRKAYPEAVVQPDLPGVVDADTERNQDVTETEK